MKTKSSTNQQHPTQNLVDSANQGVIANGASVFEGLSSWDINSFGAWVRSPFQEYDQRLIRVALYSHDTMGLGHSRRNELLAQTLVNSRWCVSILMITGIRQPNALLTIPGM